MLKDWLAAHEDRPRAEVARAIGISTVSLWRIAEGKQVPSTEVALAIERVTGIPAIHWADERIKVVRAAEAAKAAA